MKERRFEEVTVTKAELRKQLKFSEIEKFFFSNSKAFIRQNWCYNFTTSTIGYGNSSKDWQDAGDKYGKIILNNVLGNGDVILTID